MIQDHLDEIAGAGIAQYGLPLKSKAGAILLFIILDYIKPWPMSWIDSFGEDKAWAKYGDDAIAAIISKAIMKGLLHEK